MMGMGMGRGGMRYNRPKSRDINVLKNLARFLEPYTWVVVGAMVALVIAAASVLALGAGLRFLVDEGFGKNRPELLDQALMGLFALIAVMAISTYARFFLVSWVGERVVADLRREVYNHIISLNPGFFETMRVGEVLSRLTTDTTLLQTVIGSSFSVAVRSFFMLVGGVAMLIVISPQLTGPIFLVIPLVVVPIIFLGRRVRRLAREAQDRIADVGAFAEESLSSIRTVQAFCHEEVDRGLFKGRVEAAFTAAIRRVRIRALLTVSVTVLVFGSVGVVLWIGGHDVLTGEMTPGDMSAFIFYSLVVARSAGGLSEVYGDLLRAAGATERLMELLATRSSIAIPASPKPLPQPPLGTVTFEDATFHYPSRPDLPALDRFSLDVTPGETLALVGPSGAGKTTVFQLILRFYDPQRGRVTLDGMDLREIDPVEARGRTGLVPQEPMIFGANAWDNIRYGRPDADNAEVRAAAEAAAATEFLDKLPDGFDSFLGERGVRLSGGQRQRIAIARAILRNPAILLLDEATSALDAENERLVQRALGKLMVGRTTLVIAHRLATVVNADRIAVMDEGRVVATGTHAHLLETNPSYARLAALQFDPELTAPEALPAKQAAVSAGSA